MNSGKKFEYTFKSSVPDYCLYYRLPDPPQSFTQSSTLRFSWKNPCDLFLFDSHSSTLLTLELKTTKNSSFSFEDIYIEEKQPSKMIHKHQILALKEYSNLKNVISGFIFNFRNDSYNTEVTYFQSICNFLNMVNVIDKKSFNEMDLLKFNPVLMKGDKKRVNYTWDIDGFLKEVHHAYL